MVKRKRSFRLLILFAVLLVILAAGCTVYISDYYPTDVSAAEAFAAETVCLQQSVSNNAVVYVPEHPKVGLIFYPGGKVEHTAYEPLMAACAQRGILCILVKMPGNLAVLDMNAAEAFFEKYPEIETGTSAVTLWAEVWLPHTRRTMPTN